MCGFEVLEARGENCLNQDFQSLHWSGSIQ